VALTTKQSSSPLSARAPGDATVKAATTAKATNTLFMTLSSLDQLV
jgi:hypothetical protein